MKSYRWRRRRLRYVLSLEKVFWRHPPDVKSNTNKANVTSSAKSSEILLHHFPSNLFTFQSNCTALTPSQNLSPSSSWILFPKPLLQSFHPLVRCKKNLGFSKNQGWTKVSHKKKAHKMDDNLPRHPFPTDYMDPARPRRYFNCGDDRHTIKFCPKCAFLCSACNEEGHIAKNCRSHFRPLAKKVDLSDSTTLCNNTKVLAAFVVLTVTEGTPSLEMLKVRLAWLFNWQGWFGKVIPS